MLTQFFAAMDADRDGVATMSYEDFLRGVLCIKC